MSGKVIILSGASSVGKGEIKRLLLNDKELNLFESVSITTRPKKDNEQDGVDYYFTDFKFFADAIKRKELLEYTEFNGYYYGTPKQYIDFLLGIGKNVLIEVEAGGVGPLKLNLPDALAVFVMPKSLEDLEKHISEKYADNTASVQTRINKARMEMEIAPLFRHQVSNEDPQKAYEEIKEMFVKREK